MIICSLTFSVLMNFLSPTLHYVLNLMKKKKITKWGYRDGVKRKGDKIIMDCTHGAVG